MSIRIAEPDDLDLIVSMSMKFLASTDFSKYTDETVVRSVISSILQGPKETGIVLLYEDKGMLVATIKPFAYGTTPMAYELGWWIEPEHRGSGIGKELMSAYEFWASKVGAKIIMMTSLDESINKLYTKLGYKPMEYTFYKEIN